MLIPENGFNVKNAHVIGENDNLGTIELTAKDKKRNDRIEKMKSLGLDLSGMMSLGNTDWVDPLFDILNKNNVLDETEQKIVDAGYIPSKSLYPRWILSQTFHAFRHNGDFNKWLYRKGYMYSIKFLESELKKMALMQKHGDKDSLTIHRQFFDYYVVIDVIKGYINQLSKKCDSAKLHHKNGKYYINIHGMRVERHDVDKLVLQPYKDILRELNFTDVRTDAQRLYDVYKKFMERAYIEKDFKMAPDFVDAYKGLGAYYSIFNLVNFHGCFICPDCKEEKLYKQDAMEYLDNLMINECAPGWVLHGLLKKIMKQNSIDIEAKFAEWRESKTNKIPY